MLFQMECSNLSMKIPSFHDLVKEAIGFLEVGLPTSGNNPKYVYMNILIFNFIFISKS